MSGACWITSLPPHRGVNALTSSLLRERTRIAPGIAAPIGAQPATQCMPFTSPCVSDADAEHRRRHTHRGPREREAVGARRQPRSSVCNACQNRSKMWVFS